MSATFSPTSKAPKARPFHRIGKAAGAIIATAALTVGIGVAAYAEALPVPEGDASGFAVLGAETVTNTGPSTVVGDIGVHPGSAVTGYAEITHTGDLYEGTVEASDAQVSARAAWVSANAQAAGTPVGPELSGLILTPDVYDSGTFTNSGTLTLDAEGNTDAIFIFRAASTVTTSVGSSMELINGASSCNVYWIVGSSAVLGGSSTNVGTFISDISMSMGTGASLRGRTWELTGAVTLDNNNINSTCLVGAALDDEGPQVDNPPTGGVATGDGTMLTQAPSSLAVASAALLTAAVAAAMFGLQRRTQIRGIRTSDRSR